MPKINYSNIINKKINLLTIKSIKIVNKRSVADCICDCGKEISVVLTDINSGHTKSCGCFRKKIAKNNTKYYLSNIKYHPRISSAKHVFKQRYSDGDLTFEQFLDLSQQPCHYCGELPQNSNCLNFSKYRKASSFFIDNGDFTYNGLDRIDSSLPHNYSNCLSACIICNLAKNNMPYQDFLTYLKRLGGIKNNKTVISEAINKKLI